MDGSVQWQHMDHSRSRRCHVRYSLLIHGPFADDSASAGKMITVLFSILAIQVGNHKRTNIAYLHLCRDIPIYAPSKIQDWSVYPCSARIADLSTVTSTPPSIYIITAFTNSLLLLIFLSREEQAQVHGRPSRFKRSHFKRSQTRHII
jgi:hypothetical protein